MPQIVFTVRSESSGELYQLEAQRTGRGIRFSCTCPAGENGTHCKHRLAILLDDTRACVDVEPGTVAALRDLTDGSDLMACIAEMHEAEKAVAEAQAELKRTKRAVGRALQG